ncbi:hypothetical protein [Nannocystis punicea]|uniref:Uncharacterized protein n=1 Tax=Nannocystis punicea TaxID=2995304 RepID=A0ABY7GY51_9BACT|nr:hypothetical protein [Nannocystis poenicansa]WAS91847.1 hypothetical protein O0S08_37160 [Nannocystis poenicansa]
MSLAFCGERLIGSGWTQRTPINTSKRQQLTRWIEFDGTSTHRIAESTPSEGFGAACDREGKAVVAGKRQSIDLDAQVFAFMDAEGPRIPYTFHVEGDDAALGMACDVRGFCAWPGYRTADDHSVGIVQIHHP